MSDVYGSPGSGGERLNVGVTGRLAGTDMLQRSVDSVNNVLNALAGSMAEILPVLNAAKQGQSVGGKGFGAVANAASGGIAGNPTFSGEAWDSSTSDKGERRSTPAHRDTGYEGAGKRRAEGPASMLPWTSSAGGVSGGDGAGGGAHKAPGHGITSPNTVGLAVAGATAAVGMGQRIDNSVGVPMTEAIPQSHEMVNLYQTLRHGTGVSTKDFFTAGRGGPTAQSHSDWMGQQAVMLRSGVASPGTSEWDDWQSRVEVNSIANPMLSATNSAQMEGSWHSPERYNAMRMYGIETMKGGERKSTMQIANEIIGLVSSREVAMDPELAHQAVFSPSGRFHAQLVDMVRTGAVSPDQVAEIKEQAYDIIIARNHGMDADKLESTMASAAKGDSDSRDMLRDMGMWGQAHDDKIKDATEREGNVQRLEGYENALANATDGLTKFQEALNAATDAIPGLNMLRGGWQGAVSEHGLIKGTLGTVVGNPASVFPFGLSGAMTGGAASAQTGFGWLRGLFGGGGLSTTEAAAEGAAWGASSAGGDSAGLGFSATPDGAGAGTGEAAPTAVGTLGGGFDHGGGGGLSSGEATALAGGGAGLQSGPGPVVAKAVSGAAASKRYPSEGFGGVKPWVARAGHEMKERFNIGVVGGVGSRSGASDHPSGHALDFMTYSGKPLADFARSNAGRLGVTYVIWAQHIWSVARNGEGWRKMENRGSVTANHFDHVHVSFIKTEPNPGAAPTGGGGAPTGRTDDSGDPKKTDNPDVSTSGSTDTSEDYNGTSGFGTASSPGGISEAAIVMGLLGGGGGGGGIAYSDPGATMGASDGATGGGNTGTNGGDTNDPSGTSTGPGGGGGGQGWIGKSAYALLRSAGFAESQLKTAAAVMQAESGASAGAQGDIAIQTPKWGPSVGLFQIRSLKDPSGYPERDGGKLMDPMFNARSAYKISNGGTNWKPWSAYTNGSYRKFLGKDTKIQYDKGAWEIPADEDARVHQGEMIIPAAPAAQIRDVLMHGNTYREDAKKAERGGVSKGEGVTLEFREGSIQISLGAGVSPKTGRALGREFVDSVMQDRRIKELQNG